jgi:crotonobetainyl-CoA:carnitine CoA-transferase CaiB-like acyl-CoA transferase
VAELADLDTCVGPVNDVAEALADPHAVSRSLVAEIAGTPVGPGPAIKISGTEAGPLKPAPGLGEHTDEVLGTVGVDADEVASLRASGVL